ncbi:DUF6531 domain-containing protein, partial [Ideonella azotifigens]|uniref:DUF6531 domain-containing protein n=1 Tax=Ideonella azotifigens TaxID=513160 RepID=UPI0035BEBE9F
MRFIYRKGSTQFGSAVVDRNYLALATFIASVWIIPQSAIAWSCTSDGQLYDCQRPIPGTYSGDVSHQWIGWVRNVTAGPRKASIIKPLETAISEETAKSLLSYRSVYSQCSGTDGKPLQTVMRGSDVPSAASDFYVYQSGEYYFGESINWCQNGSIRVTYPIQGEYSARFNIPRIDQCAPGTIKWDWDYGNLGHDTDLVDYAICYIPVEQSCPAFGDPITATGTKFQTEVDWSEPNAFLQLRRTYVSSPRFDGGAMGAYTLGRLMPNWRFGFQSYIGFDGDQVTVFREDSKSVSFAKIGNDLVPVVPGKTALTQLASGDFLFRSGDNLFEIYDPTGKLQKIVGSAGLNATLNYTNSGEISSIVDGFGRSLLFHYYKLDDGDGVMYSYLDSVSLPDDSLVDYGVLSPRGVLSSVNYADGSGRSYGYADMGGKGPLLLTQVNDEEGASFGTKYSSSGMSIATSAPRDIDDWAIVDKRVSGSGDIIVTDPLAQELRLSYSKVNGRSLLGGQSRPGGSGCSANVSSQSYDANSNVTNKVDFGGNRSCFAYNTSRNLETARIEGLSGATACPADVASYSVVSSATAPQRKVTTQWHPVWNLQTRVAEPNLITTTVYNGLPDPIAGDTPVCAPDAPLLPDGSKIAVVCRRYEEATTDTLGNVGFAATVTERRSWSYTYNVYGQMQIETDPRGKRTTYKY